MDSRWRVRLSTRHAGLSLPSEVRVNFYRDLELVAVVYPTSASPGLQVVSNHLDFERATRALIRQPGLDQVVERVSIDALATVANVSIPMAWIAFDLRDKPCTGRVLP